MGDTAVLRLIVVHAHLISQRRSLKGIVIKIRPAARQCHYAQERTQATSHSPPHLIRTPSIKIDHGPVKVTGPWTRFVVRRAAVFPCSSKGRQVTQAYDLDRPARPVTQLIAVTLITLKQHEKRFLVNSQPLVANCFDDSGKRRKLVRWLLA